MNYKLFSGTKYFKPVAIGILNEVDAHLLILKGDAAHGLVFGEGSGVVVGLEGEVELLIAEVVRLGTVAHPGQLQQVFAAAVGEVDDDEFTTRRSDPPHLLKFQRLRIKLQASFEIKNVEIVVDEFEFHSSSVISGRPR